MKIRSRITILNGAKWRFVVVALLITQKSQAMVLYSNDFENTSVGQFESPAGLNAGYSGIDYPGLSWRITSTGGVGNSKGLDALIDGRGRRSYTIGFGPYLSASDMNPFGNGSVSAASQIRFSVDVKATGNLNATPLWLRVWQEDNTYEADRQIDTNMDGDLSDGAIIFQSDYTPILNPGGYTHASYTLDQGQISAGIFASPTQFIPLPPQFDPTIPLLAFVYFGIDGFGSDLGNIVSADNFLIQAIPEPSTLLLLGLGAISLLGRRKAKSHG